jgi:hypothetical protein
VCAYATTFCGKNLAKDNEIYLSLPAINNVATLHENAPKPILKKKKKEVTDKAKGIKQRTIKNIPIQKMTYAG